MGTQTTQRRTSGGPSSLNMSTSKKTRLLQATVEVILLDSDKAATKATVLRSVKSVIVWRTQFSKLCELNKDPVKNIKSKSVEKMKSFRINVLLEMDLPLRRAILNFLC